MVYLRLRSLHPLLVFVLLLLLLATAPGAIAQNDHGDLQASLVKDIVPGLDYSLPHQFTELNGMLMFSARTALQGQELWRSDGTAAGTQLIKDISPGSGSGVNGSFIPYNGLIYFNGCDPDFGCELWKTDGTEAGTTRVTDLAPGPDSMYFRGFLFEDHLYLQTNVPTGSYWRSDGTAAGTEPVDLVAWPFTFNQGPQPVLFNGQLIFQTADGKSAELLIGDGSPAGTTTLLAFATPWFDVDFIESFWYPTVFNDRLYVIVRKEVAQNGAFQPTYALWSSDGTPAGTALLVDFGVVDVKATMGYTTVVGDQFFFVIDNALWVSDGSAAGTRRVVPDTVADPPTRVRYLFAYNGELYFEGVTDQYGVDLWKSDGTAAGTQLVRDIDILPAHPEGFVRIFDYTLFDGDLYFVAITEGHGAELWRTDGSEAGTLRVTDLNPGPAWSIHPAGFDLLVIGQTLFFSGDDGQSGPELWKLAPASATRVTEGLVALYTFEEGSGRTVQDRSGVGSALDLTLSRTSGYTWLADGLRLNGGTALYSAGPASKIIAAAKAGEEVTVEAWVTPADVAQYSARIATISGSTTRRNLSLIHGVYDSGQPSVASARIRTNPNIPDGGRALFSPSDTLGPRLIHLVFTRSADGTTHMYADGVQVAAGSRTGSLSSWDDGFRLGLGGEIGGQRYWRGTYHLVAFYGRALSAAEVEHNFSLGPNGP